MKVSVAVQVWNYQVYSRLMAGAASGDVKNPTANTTANFCKS